MASRVMRFELYAAICNAWRHYIFKRSNVKWEPLVTLYMWSISHAKFQQLYHNNFLLFTIVSSNMINYMERPQSKSIIIKQDLLLCVANRIKSKHENEGKNPLKSGIITYNQLFRVIFRALMVYKINIKVFFFFTQNSKILNYCPSSTSHHFYHRETHSSNTLLLSILYLFRINLEKYYWIDAKQQIQLANQKIKSFLMKYR